MLDRLDAHAEENGISNVTTVAADMRTLPFEDESFDAVVSNYAFHHLVDADKAIALAEARRVLVPGGRLVVCDMMFSLSLQPRDRKLLAEKVVAIAKRGPSGLLRIARNAGRAVVGAWEHPATPEAWEQMLVDRHFAQVRVELLVNEAGLATARRPGG
jgi:ubiquinone/menaquinone biosynthesis C-methylase UbiE